ncbi:ral GTPase-activating protein subunit alpha-1 [Aplysia californica]|uniref:Ral GTPase-activating protein subunit alpha-1 n=1 Tax=Aplysia californica TaxID=6500 RepID=A0ABM1VVI4_APLCA|nr:ral GTPase-activating protein subunit alpha-1 [Aplysia californica]
MSATLALFRKTAGHGDIKKSAQKVADTKKDTVTRLKHLRLVLDNYEIQDAKKFFLENYSHIYYIFYDNFGTVEADLKQRANKAHREELEAILFIFEKILFLLPEIVHKRWMFHSIGRIIKKLIHPGNSLQLRRQGVRLFLVWYQCLQENASEECHRIFLSLVPGLGDGPDLMTLMTDNTASADNIGGIIAAGEITAILPSQSEKIPENVTKYFLDNLLNYMVSEVIKVEWMNSEMREQSFHFLFTKFKAKYLHWLLPDFVYRDIYDPIQELPTARSKEDMRKKDEPSAVSECRDSFIFWLANFTVTSHKPDPELHKGLSCSLLTEPSSHTGESRDSGPGRGEEEEEGEDSKLALPGSKGSSLSAEAGQNEKEAACGDWHSVSEYDIVRAVLYSTRENVNIVHECFRQALLQSFKHTAAIRKVISVYKEWFQREEDRPVFMLEPMASERDLSGGVDGACEESPLDGLRPGSLEFHHSSLSDIVEEDRNFMDDSPSTSALSLHHLTAPTELEDGTGRPSYLRNRSYLGAVQDLADQGEDKAKDVRAGFQRVMQVFINNAANIFLLDADDDTYLQDQVELCKRVMNIYRHVVMNVEMNQLTWELMLKVLLKITSGVLKKNPPEERYRTLGGRLAQPILQTLIVTWTKANLNVLVTASLWDEFLAVLSSLTSWKELIHEWSKTMETLTRVLARQVYGLDLNDLPLERLSEQKEKRRRGRESTKGKPSSSTTTSTSAKAVPRLDKSFSRGLSGSDGHPINPLRSSTNSAPSPETSASFDRGTKYKSDGAGGKVRPDLSKQKSLSGEPSPSHSRCPSTSTECLVRSSSEGNIAADPHELLEKLRASNSPCAPDDGDEQTETDSDLGKSAANDPGGVVRSSGASAAVEDVEVAEITTTCTAELSSMMGPHSVVRQSSLEEGFDRSDHDMTRGTGSRTSSACSMHSARSKSGSRSPSPPLLNSTDNHKDSPTPDRDSLHIDITGPEDANSNRGLEVSVDSLDELKSIMAGGKVLGWTPDVAVVLWQRMLGSLGDVNKMEDPDIHFSVFDELAELMDTLCRMSDNLGVTQDNMSSPPPPELIPPLHIFSSWLFQCLTLSNKFKHGKLMAYQLICQMMLRRHEVMPSQQLLSHFYLVLHTGLVSADQDIVNVLVRDCGPKFFSLCLPGCLLLTLDFIKAAGSIISAVDYKEPPRAEAVTVLGSLLYLPHHVPEIPALEPEATGTTRSVQGNQLKDLVLDLLLKAGKREPAGLARCVAVSSVAIFLYGELSHGTMHPKMKEAINVLLGALMSVNKKVAKVASDMLLLLCDHVDKLLDYHPQMPKKITEAVASTISALIPSHGASNSDEEKRLIVSMMFCMVEWCLKMPMPLLMETTDTDKSCIYKVFRVLHSAVTGHSSSSLTRVSKSLSDFLLDTDFTNIWDTQSGSLTPQPGPSSASQRPFSADATLADAATDQTRPSLASQHSETGRKPETDIVKLAARALMSHLVHHMSHFPMGSGAARLHTLVQEHHDLPDYLEDDLRPEIFQAPNVQFFVLNHRCLISFIELPAVDAPGGGVTAGLMTARTVCRIIVRDLCGKYCWENSVLYSPPWCTKGSSRHNAQTLLGLATGAELEPLLIQEASDTRAEQDTLPTPTRGLFPQHGDTPTGADNLNNMLAYIGDTSPECLLRPGMPLNIAARVPEDLTEQAESAVNRMVGEQTEAEEEHRSTHRMDIRRDKDQEHMVAPPEMPAESQDPVSPFQMCRLLLDQMGLLSWEKRCHFDLLKKSDKVLRELKNLDVQKCRETHKIAVIYIAAGQEDKNSILSNNSGSRAFEDFVAGLGWEVELESHQGFMGGLQQNRTTGNTAPYWANSTCEVVFHVSTRIPSTGTDWHIKMRHLGNDEVHIVWSEHSRDYRRGIIPTEFGDIIIIIYPLPSGLFRIQINRKPEVPFFGPLFDGAIVDQQVLSGLVRATAVNASRLKRSLMPFYHAFYEERAKCLETIIQQHTEHTMFEEFAENVFAPVLPANAAIVDVTLPSESSSSSLNELSQGMAGDLTVPQMSPNSGRQRASDSALLDVQYPPTVSSETRLQRTARRWSIKSRRASGSKVPPSPGSPTSCSPSPTVSALSAATAFLLPPPDSPKSKNGGGGRNSVSGVSGVVVSGGLLTTNSSSNNNNNNNVGVDMVESPRAKSGKSKLDTNSPKTKHGKSRSESPKAKSSKK